MSASTKFGFTIIEVILFLGITGALVASIFIGTGNSIGVQRYRDSVVSLQAFLQKQYSEIENVDNQNNFTESTAFCGNMTYKGQSNCAYLGRFITVSNLASGSRLVTQNVIGRTPAASASSFNDISVFGSTGYNIRVSSATNSVYNYDLEWGAQIVNTAGASFNFSILILRSPASGVIRTFVNNTAIVPSGNIQSSTLLLSQAGLTKSIKMCVKPNNNNVVSGRRRAVVLNANASGASGIELLTENDSGC